MKIFSLHPDISFVSDHDKLVVLNFETGEYFTAEGLCMTILQILENQSCNEFKLREQLSNMYDSNLYDLDESLIQAMRFMADIGFVRIEERE